MTCGAQHMKKNMIALLLSIVMTAGSIGGTPALAAETTAEEAAVEGLSVEDVAEDDAQEFSSQDETEQEKPKQEDSQRDEIQQVEKQEPVDDPDDLSEKDTSQQETINDESADVESITNEGLSSETGSFRREGACGNNVTWVLTGTNPDTDPDLTLTISGTGVMQPDVSTYYDNYIDWTLYNGVIRNVVIEEGVTGIGDKAFQGFIALETISIPNSVTSIGNQAFYECRNLEGIEIPDSVTSIGGSAFGYCDMLTNITLPDNVTSMGGSVFMNCVNLTSVSMPNGITSIEDWTFDYCTRLTSVTLPNSLTSIGYSAFRNCHSLTSVEIPDGVTSIGESAFMHCTSLASITLPDSVESIGKKAFEECYGLVSINIPNGVFHIEELTFRECRNLTNITLPNSVTSIGNYAFSNCNGFTNIIIPDNVTSIGNYAFQSCLNLASITIPDSVTSIGEGVFWVCSNLTSINIPNSVAIIPHGAFYGCSSLESIEIPDSVTNILDEAFKSCRSLTDVAFPDSVTHIGAQAFSDCQSLNSVALSNNLISISDSAFSGCGSLNNIVIPDSVTSIGDYVFSGCGSLTNIVIPNGVTSIAQGTFYNCKSLEEIVIPDSVTIIADNAFSGCESLANISLPNSLKNIGNTAFEDCSSLTSISIPDGVKFIGEEAFLDCVNLEKAEIPSSVISIGQTAFYQQDPERPLNNLTIYGYSGSCAEQYANENEIPFVSINGMSWEDGSGVYHSYTIALQATSNGCYITCDVGAKNGDGRYTETKMDNPDLNVDATQIKAYEKFELVKCTDGSYALRSVVNRKFLGLSKYNIVFYGDFIENEQKLILSKGSKGRILFKQYNRWLCVEDGKLTFTDDFDKAEEFNQILIDDNTYKDELKVLGSDEWFNLNNQDKGGYYDIQRDIGIKKEDNAVTLKALGYTMMNEPGQFERDYIELGNLQCFVAYKKTNDNYDVIIAFQGTGGYGGFWGPIAIDSWRDYGSNMTGGTYTDDDGFHKGYHEMANKLRDKETTICDPEDHSINLAYLIAENAHFTILGHSMGGAIAQCYAVHLAKYRSVSKEDIKGRTFNSALAYNSDDDDFKGFTDWYNLCVTTDTVCNGLVPGSIIYYGINRLGKTIWLYDDTPDEDTFHLPKVNIAEKKHNMDQKLHSILYSLYEANKCVHEWGPVTTTAVSTLSKNGERRCKCTKCSEDKIEIIPCFGGIQVSGLKSMPYTGKAITLKPVVKFDDNTLEENKDYTVSYKNNTNIGTAEVSFTGKGDYSGTITKEFSIVKAPNTITAKSFTRTYSTNAQTFDLGVKIKNGTPTYKSNSKSVTVSKAGKVTVKAKFIGKATITITAPASKNYTATTKKITITVNPTKTALSSVTSPSAGKMTVKWKKNAVGTGYQIQFSTSSKFEKPKSVTIAKNSTLTKTIGSLAKGKKYYVRIRTYKTVGKTKFYSGWSAAKTVTIRK